MRKLLAVLAVLLGCLAFVGQAVASVSAGYSDCCLQGCEGMAHCATASCQTCAAPQPAPAPQRPAAPAAEGLQWCSTKVSFDAGSRPEPWTPPD
ncbi:hypothetical protein [Roseateles sp. LYH14W]|uniref:Uncharacterized protein n=1 Tax=Pelomonas parva TaxID=3299032 RepID=A0ABW7F1U3_9BURK